MTKTTTKTERTSTEKMKSEMRMRMIGPSSEAAGSQSGEKAKGETGPGKHAATWSRA